LRLLEYESKQILKKYGLKVPDGVLVTSSSEAPSQMDYPVVLKAQIPVGGRGKAGGILDANSQEDASAEINNLFSKQIREYRAKRVLVEPKVDIQQEFFMAVTYDTVAKTPIAIFSSQGGVDIEEIAKREPDKVHQEHFSLRDRLPDYKARAIVAETGVTGKLLLGLGNALSRLAQIFIDYDATIAEINPLALTRTGQLVALDCHIDVDEDAMFRNKEIAEIDKDTQRFESSRQQSEFERKAAEIDKLDHRGVAGRVIEFGGNLGLIIGGGGASLTAFDAIQAHGGRPANYCEIGGNPSVLKVKELTRHLLTKPGVEKVAVIMNVVSNTRVDLVARGIIKGILETGKNPGDTVAVFRIPGAWEDEGSKILSKYGVRFCDRTVSIDEAAKIAVENS
jgi:succinyl-CoA synthetase beta subunit/citryl-CoA synthetase large subunit